MVNILSHQGMQIKTTMSCNFTYTRTAKVRLTIPSVDEDVEHLELPYLADRRVKNRLIVRDYLARVIMEAEKLRDLLSASLRPRETGGIF